MPEPESFEVAIIGGGPAGSAAAICLARRGIRTVLIERSDYSAARVGETLPPAIRSPLRTLGVWRQFLEDGPNESFAVRSAWGSAELRETEHILNPYGPGWHVDRARFDRMLAQAATNAGATLLTQTRFERLSKRDPAVWRLRVRRGGRPHALDARFLIEAAGRSASLPPGLPRSFRVIDRLIGSMRFFTTSTGPYTLIEAAAFGWWYSAPLPDGRLIVAYMTDADLHAIDRSNPGSGWRRRLDETELTRERVGSQQILGKPMIVSAASLLRRPAYGADWIAAGDAASAFDPLSGQGVYQALEGGMRAAEAVIARLGGASESFSQYGAWIDLQFRRYLQMRDAFYGMERRWSGYPFWRRRANTALSSYGITELSPVLRQQVGHSL